MQLVVDTANPEANDLSTYLLQSGLFLVLALVVTWWANKRGVFSALENPDFLPGATNQNYKKVKWYHLLTGFAALIFVQIFLIGLASRFFPDLTQNPVNLGWTVFGVNLIFAIFLALYIKMEKLESIVYSIRPYAKYGVLMVFIALPWVFLTSTISHFIVVELLDSPPVEQNPITFLQSFDLGMPVFYVVALSIFTIIPFNEEILFRGFFQNFMTKISNKWVGLILTPLFFTLVHYQYGQGTSNIELLAPLFVLAVFLSYLYQKTGSLVATILFHMTFNFLSVIGLFLDKLGIFVE